ncbi:MAG: hypothetical protein ACTS2F_24770 [Thainema sp.]
MRLSALYQEQQQLQDQIEQLLQAGDCLQGVRLEFTPAGGTASDNAKQTCRYARLRAGRCKLLDNGKKSKYIQLHQIAEYKAAIARGKQLTRLTRRLRKVEAEIAKIEAVARELGLELPSD